jgi:hypothetical protein
MSAPADAPKISECLCILCHPSGSSPCAQLRGADTVVETGCRLFTPADLAAPAVCAGIFFTACLSCARLLPVRALLPVLPCAVVLRTVGGEIGAAASLAPKVGPLGLVRRMSVQCHGAARQPSACLAVCSQAHPWHGAHVWGPPVMCAAVARRHPPVRGCDRCVLHVLIVPAVVLVCFLLPCGAVAQEGR